MSVVLDGVIDSHVHLAHDWREGGQGLRNSWLPGEPESFQRDWTEADLRADIAQGRFGVAGCVFVECSNKPPEEEAKWVLRMVGDPDSMIVACVAQVPCPSGAAAVRAFLDSLRGPDGSLPRGLKGGRVVFLGDPMPPADACLGETFLEGLGELQKHGLLWEWCCQPAAIPYIAEVCRRFPETSFVLDHLGHNAGGNDFDTWAPAIDALAKCTNVVAKLGAIEQWEVDSPDRYLDHALKSFGWDRVMAESNWMVNVAMKGDGYDATFSRVMESCARLGATDDQVRKVFAGNARRVYSLD